MLTIIQPITPMAEDDGMTQARPAEVGMTIEEVDTPALVVDLPAYERNLARLAERVAERGVRIRPHSKTHKSPAIAREQMDRGAVGVCCQKVGEAEVMVEGGVRDVLVSNQVVGGRKIARLAALARHARVSVCVDDAGNLAEIAAAAVAFGSEIGVLVEIDVGMARCGVPPGEAAVRLAEAVDGAAAGLRFAGLQAYHGGAQHIRDRAERRAAVMDAAALTRSTIDALARVGLACETIAGGGTGTLEFDLEAGVLNELQAGSYIFMDADYAGVLDSFEHSLFVRATVMSAPTPTRRVTDAGLKALAFDSGPPLVHGIDGASYVGPSDEHGTLTIGNSVELGLGDAVMLIPGHCDPTVNLYDWYVGFRDGVVERVWPVAARGRLS